jgi:hypothetical protein
VTSLRQLIAGLTAVIAFESYSGAPGQWFPTGGTSGGTPEPGILRKVGLQWGTCTWVWLEPTDRGPGSVEKIGMGLEPFGGWAS